MKKKPTMKAAMKKWEGSAADEKMDRRMARKMTHKSKVKSAAQKAFGGRYS